MSVNDFTEPSIHPARTTKVLTPHDSEDFTDQPAGIIVGAGTIVFVNKDGSTVSFTDGELAAGIVHPLSPKRINATGTSARVIGVY